MNNNAVLSSFLVESLRWLGFFLVAFWSYVFSSESFFEKEHINASVIFTWLVALLVVVGAFKIFKSIKDWKILFMLVLIVFLTGRYILPKLIL